MGEKTYRFCNQRKWKDFNKKNSSPYLKCVLHLSCVVYGPIYGRFMGFSVNGFLSLSYKKTMPMLADAHISSLGYLWAHLLILRRSF